MNNLKTSFQWLLFLLLINLSAQVYCQKTIEIYLGDTSFYRTYDGESRYYFDFKPVLPDGNYLLYDVWKKDSMSRYKSVILKGQFKNGKREGEFLTDFSIIKKKKRTLQGRRQWFYLNGLKNGLDDEYFYDDCNHRYLTQHGEYSMGKKNGYFMEMDRKFNLGSVACYHNDTLNSFTDYFSFDNLIKYSHIECFNKDSFSISIYNNNSDIYQITFYAKNNQFVRYKIFDNQLKVLEDHPISIYFASKDIFYLLRVIKTIRIDDFINPDLRKRVIEILSHTLSHDNN